MEASKRLRIHKVYIKVAVTEASVQAVLLGESTYE